ncbi:PQQ-binding-like beta-propeller repeat protein [Nitrosopumilus sp.]|uniref:outer membrane protein assembly factor BamB family protein n=1 Tax=Nitrosopumilus sp. TaxID=2024843 RepID=UPI00247D7ED1|nr:PQQ-binding-like beta-propeller repeat protein [Nitrosopumilus sp.]MCV0409607.1 PQQ-binding-like beta-propeller repeat protein [Nitrosopumilus sp.]
MKSRLLIIVVMLMMVITITTNHVFAMCAYDPTNPHKPCDDLRAMLIIESHETQLKNIDGKLYHVIGPFTLQSQSEDAIRLGDTEFTYPYYPVPIPPGGVMTVEITFSDGIKESIGRVGPPTPFIEFTDHDDPKAGVKHNSDGTFNFLLSVETNSILPLKQLKLAIPFDEIQCKDELILIQKYDGSPACVTESTKQKLVERGWIKIEIKDSNNSLLQKWTYDTKGEISSIDISKDDSIIVVGTAIRDTQKGMLYLLDNDGMLLWEEEFDSMINHVDISNNTILVNGFHICGGGGGARTHCNYTVDIFDIQGNNIQSYAHDDNTSFGASLSPNGSQIITHTYDVLEYFDIQENDSWMYDPDESIRHATFLTDSTLLVNTDNAGEIIALDNTGDELWNFATNYPDNYSYATSSNGKYFAVSDYTSPDDGNIYLLDSNGNLLWQANTGNTVLHLEFSGDDSRILAELNGAFMVYDMQGNLLWKNNIPSNLTMSSFGSFLLGTIFNQGSGASITLFDGKGNILSNYPADKESLGAVFALANSDEYFVMANDTNQLVMFEVIPDFDKVYYDLTDIRDSEDLHVKIVPKIPGLFDVAIAKGDSVEIPWDIKFEQGYARSNFDVSIASDSDIESQITPTSPYTPINGVPPGEKIIIIHPKPDATTENYTVQILGRGDTVHNQTGWMTNLDGKILGTINVNVIPKPLGLQRVLDSCNSTGIQPSVGYRYSNDTHTIANNSCEWQTIEEYENEN